MPRKRSRSYPYYSLEKALEISKMIHEIGGNGVAPVESILSEMNIKSDQNKRYSYLTSSAKQYGLIENENDGFKTTQLAISILYPSNDNDSKVIISRKRAATNPELYKEILLQYNGSILPKNEFLENNFIQKGIINSVVEVAVQSFLDTIKFAEIINEEQRISIDERFLDQNVEIEKINTIKPENSKMVYSKIIHEPLINEELHEKPVQEINQKEINNAFNLEIPLNSGKKAYINIPKEITEEEIRIIKNFIDAIKTYD